MKTFLMIFQKISDHFPKVSNDFPKCSKGQMNVSEHFLQLLKIARDCLRLPKMIKQDLKYFDHTCTPTNLSVKGTKLTNLPDCCSYIVIPVDQLVTK